MTNGEYVGCHSESMERNHNNNDDRKRIPKKLGMNENGVFQVRKGELMKRDEEGEKSLLERMFAG